MRAQYIKVNAGREFSEEDTFHLQFFLLFLFANHLFTTGTESLGDIFSCLLAFCFIFFFC